MTNEVVQPTFPSQRPKTLHRLLTWGYGVWFAIGMVLLLTRTLPASLQWANGVYLMLAGTVGFVWLWRRLGARLATGIAGVTGMVTYGAEWFGVQTGWWFGTYTYGDAFTPFLFGVPWAIPFAWLTVLMMAVACTPQTIRSRLMWSLWGALLAGAFDLMLDPVAFAQGYWTWEKTSAWQWYGIPWTNFACWVLTSFVVLYVTAPAWRRAFNAYVLWCVRWDNTPLWLTVTLFSLFGSMAWQHGLVGALLGALLPWIVAIGYGVVVGGRRDGHALDSGAKTSAF